MTTTTDLLSRLLDAVDGSAREGTDDDAVDGLRPRWVVSPADTAGVSAVLRVAHDEGLAVLPRGSGTKLGWGAPPERLDVLLELGRLDDLVDHAAGDLVAVVGAGRRLDDLQADLASAGQWFAVDPTRRGTLGGLVATADTGPTRLVHGPVRDLVIGATVVRADGVVAHAGGRVVKNVAGYDLSKLLTGSFGTLGVLTQVAVRLHPVPEASRWVVVPVSSGQHAGELVQRVVHSQLVMTACELERPGKGDARLAVRLDGISAGVPARADAAERLLGAGAEQLSEAPAWWGRDPGESGDLRLKVTHEIASVSELLAAVDEVSQQTGVPLDLRGSAAVGTVGVALRGRPDDAAVGRVLDGLRQRSHGLGGTVVVRDAEPGIRRQVDVWGPVAGLDLMRRVKDQLDPGRVLAPGRFVGGI
ncbi:MAG: FAD-binding oxidoreductase [Actinomycetota bacterium]|nr:FAD-binding oxidoreductase [Actinomycetota bacterium]